MKKILIADALDKEALEQLKAVPGFEVTVKTGMDEAALVETIPGYNAVVVRSATKMTKPVIDASTDLGDHRPGRHRAGQRGCRGGQGQRHQGGQHAGGDDDLGRRTCLRPDARRRAASTAWPTSTMKQHKWEKKVLHGTELYGKTLGLIGCGRIGLAVAERAIAFGMTVVAYDVIPIKTKLCRDPGPPGRAPGPGRRHLPPRPQDAEAHPRRAASSPR